MYKLDSLSALEHNEQVNLLNWVYMVGHRLPGEQE